VIVGQQEVLEQVMIALFVGGHCLITGLPGTAKTLLVRTMAQTLGLVFKRIQFTPDLMPSDITGTDIIEEDPGNRPPHLDLRARTHFRQHSAADEINRTPPKTQSACSKHAGARLHGARQQLRPAEPVLRAGYAEPDRTGRHIPAAEAQLDRFLFNTVLDYLDAAEELQVVDLTTVTPSRKPKR